MKKFNQLKSKQTRKILIILFPFFMACGGPSNLSDVKELIDKRSKGYCECKKAAEKEMDHNTNRGIQALEKCGNKHLVRPDHTQSWSASANLSNAEESEMRSYAQKANTKCQ